MPRLTALKTNPNGIQIHRHITGQSVRGLAHSKTLRAGRAGSPLPAADCNQRIRVRPDGAHGVTRPTIRASVLDCGGAPLLQLLQSCSPFNPAPGVAAPAFATLKAATPLALPPGAI